MAASLNQMFRTSRSCAAGPGHVQALFSAYPSLKGAVETNRVKLLATNGAQRSPLAPNVPSLAEVIPGFDLITLIGVYARSSTPPAVVQKIAAEASAVVKEPDVVPQFAALGMEPAGEGPDEFARHHCARDRARDQGGRERRHQAAVRRPRCAHVRGAQFCYAQVRSSTRSQFR